jgi:hypothetical protein
MLVVCARARFGVNEPPDPPWVLIDRSDDGGETWTEAIDFAVREQMIWDEATYSRSPDYRVRWVVPEPPDAMYFTLRVWLP